MNKKIIIGIVGIFIIALVASIFIFNKDNDTTNNSNYIIDNIIEEDTLVDNEINNNPNVPDKIIKLDNSKLENECTVTKCTSKGCSCID